ncbi:MAG: hypothetical protein FWH06_02140 [Oscillospiraceae bacterium]|nr:hypothetical protein [Oscillospiraceae bacterium]
MFALLETEYVRARPMTRHSGRPPYNIVIRRLAGCKIAVARVLHGETGGPRRAAAARTRYWRALDAALSEINAMGVRMAVVSGGFVGAERLRRYGLSPPDQAEVFRRSVPALAAEQAKRILRSGRAGAPPPPYARGIKAAVITDHVGTAARKAVFALLPYTAAMCITGRGAEPLCETLRADYGLAAQTSAAALKGSELAVCLKPWEGDFWAPPQTTLILAEGFAKRPSCRVVDSAPPPGSLDAPAPGGVDAAMWNAALFLDGG